MAKTESIRAFPESIEYFDNLVDDRNIQNRPQAIKSTIDKAIAYDKYCVAMNNDCR